MKKPHAPLHSEVAGMQCPYMFGCDACTSVIKSGAFGGCGTAAGAAGAPDRRAEVGLQDCGALECISCNLLLACGTLLQR
jgi:hypothetical protein